VNFASRSRIKWVKRRPALSMSAARVAGHLGCPGSGRVGGDAE
jgi:hypothetical protein